MEEMYAEKSLKEHCDDGDSDSDFQRDDEFDAADVAVVVAAVVGDDGDYQHRWNYYCYCCPLVWNHYYHDSTASKDSLLPNHLTSLIAVSLTYRCKNIHKNNRSNKNIFK